MCQFVGHVIIVTWPRDRRSSLSANRRNVATRHYFTACFGWV